MQVYEKTAVEVENFNHEGKNEAGADAMQVDSIAALKVPTIKSKTRQHEAKCKREYCNNTHLYFIHSVSVCSDQTTFMTADDLNVYLWDLERADSSLRALDIRPAVPDEHEVRVTPGLSSFNQS
jgi:serine/threonine-protein phosphatase 2A regulatory subunit B